MTSRHILAASVAMIAAIELAACASQPVSAFSYQLAPCPPTATAAGAALVPNLASPGESYPSATARPPAPAASALDVPGASGAGGTLQPTVPSCVAAVSNYDYAGDYPFEEFDWPSYGGIGFDGFIDGHFRRGFDDHDFRGHEVNRGFHGHGSTVVASIAAEATAAAQVRGRGRRRTERNDRSRNFTLHMRRRRLLLKLDLQERRNAAGSASRRRPFLNFCHQRIQLAEGFSLGALVIDACGRASARKSTHKP